MRQIDISIQFACPKMNWEPSQIAIFGASFLWVYEEYRWFALNQAEPEYYQFHLYFMTRHPMLGVFANGGVSWTFWRPLPENQSC